MTFNEIPEKDPRHDGAIDLGLDSDEVDFVGPAVESGTTELDPLGGWEEVDLGDGD